MAHRQIGESWAAKIENDPKLKKAVNIAGWGVGIVVALLFLYKSFSNGGGAQPALPVVSGAPTLPAPAFNSPPASSDAANDCFSKKGAVIALQGGSTLSVGFDISATPAGTHYFFSGPEEACVIFDDGDDTCYSLATGTHYGVRGGVVRFRGPAGKNAVVHCRSGVTAPGEAPKAAPTPNGGGTDQNHQNNELRFSEQNPVDL